jgi:hypothetical protein
MVVLDLADEVPQPISVMMLDLKSHDFGQTDSRTTLTNEQPCNRTQRRLQPKLAKPDVRVENNDHVRALIATANYCLG